MSYGLRECQHGEEATGSKLYFGLRVTDEMTPRERRIKSNVRQRQGQGQGGGPYLMSFASWLPWMLYKLFEGGWRILHKRRKRRKSGKKRSPVKQRQPQTHKKTPKEHQKTGHWVIYYTNAARNKHSVPSGLVPEYFEPLSRDLRLQSAGAAPQQLHGRKRQVGTPGKEGK